MMKVRPCDLELEVVIEHFTAVAISGSLRFLVQMANAGQTTVLSVLLATEAAKNK